MIDKKFFENISEISGMDAGSIYAIVRTESNGVFSWSGGRIPILYERHWAFRFYKKKYSKEEALRMSKIYPNIISPIPGGYGKFSEQYNKLALAIKIFGEDIAHSSTSFGAFQIMGFNYEACGYASAKDMSDSYHNNPKENQVIGFIKFCKNYKNGKLLKEIKKKNWDKVAYYYNGKNYKNNRYAAKLRIAYARYYDEVL